MESAKRNFLIVFIMALLIHFLFLGPLLVQIAGKPFDLFKEIQEKQKERELAELRPQEALVMPEVATTPDVQSKPEEATVEDPEQKEEEKPLEEQLPESDSAILAPADKLVEPVTDSKPEEKT